ncbi:calponin homology domain-containing protein [Tribonema minus]|uniref:Calponin homology domain-containing protein n=1 Tax=Tribonema minus TaxID=303371 RepID=A0A835YKZ4_9STRA|nr:calponin homology domain-containing protein [Tribonema minus]
MSLSIPSDPLSPACYPPPPPHPPLRARSYEETVAFSAYVNQAVGAAPQLAHRLPIAPATLVRACADGVVLCHLVNEAAAGSVPERLINRREPLSIFQATENCNHAIAAVRALGCPVVNIGARDITEEKTILLLALLWQIIKAKISSQVSLAACPRLRLLREPGESEAAFAALPVEQLLLRWFNHQLHWAGAARRLRNLDRDLADAECYAALLRRLGRGGGGARVLALERCRTPRRLAEHVINAAATDLGVAAVIHAAHITSGNARLNMAFIAQLVSAAAAAVTARWQC